MKTIDLNCDLGEGVGNESSLMPHLSSCNISCGLHAGNDQIIDEVIQLAIKHDVRIGAHPSFDDRANFGRKEINMSDKDLQTLVYDQVVGFKKRVEHFGGKLQYVKPHGALYNMAAKSVEISHSIIASIVRIDPTIRLMGLSSSEMERASNGKIGFIAEAFIDRKYFSVNELLSRTQGGLIKNFEEVEDQLKLLLTEGLIPTSEGLQSLKVESLCLHGDTPGAVELIIKVRKFIDSLGIEITSS